MSQTTLENQMRSIICSLKPGTEFLLRDIIDNPPALLGRRLYEAVENGSITGVVFIGKFEGYAKYRKL